MGGKYRDPQQDLTQRDRENLKHSALNRMSPSNPFPQSSEKSGGGKNVRATGDGEHQENKMLANQLRKAHMNLQGIHGSLCMYYSFWFSVL